MKSYTGYQLVGLTTKVQAGVHFLSSRSATGEMAYHHGTRILDKPEGDDAARAPERGGAEFQWRANSSGALCPPDAPLSRDDPGLVKQAFFPLGTWA